MSQDLESTCVFSHGMRTEDVMGGYTAFKGLRDLSALRKNPDEAPPEPVPSADQEVNNILGGGRRGSIRRRSFPKNSVPTSVSPAADSAAAPPALVWKQTNRLDVYYGADFHPFETAVESMARASRKEFGLVAKGAANRLLRGDRDAADEHLFRASLGQLKSHPRMKDFLATVVLTADSDFVIGEFFRVSYKYTNKKDAGRLHSPGDWIGIFRLPGDDKGAAADLSNDAIAVEPLALVCWCEIPADLNEATLTVDRQMIKSECHLRALYFVSGSDRPSAGSSKITPHFVKAKIVVQGPKQVRDRDKFRVIDGDTVEIFCGVPLNLHVTVEHSNSFLHNPLDSIGLIRDTVETQKSKCFRTLYPPADSNAGQVCLERGVSLPGTYRVYYFSHECNERICGCSLRIRAVRDFGEGEKEREKKIHNRQFQVYLSTRWDMTIERAAWKNEIAPKLKRYCDDRFIDFAYVDIHSENDALALQTGDAVKSMLRGIKECSPFFVACMGDMLSLEVHPKSIPRELASDIMSEFPWVEDVLMGPHVHSLTTTEIEFAAGVFIPLMSSIPVNDGENGEKTTLRHRHIVLRHPSMYSQNFPDHTKGLKGVNTISNIKKMKDDMRNFMSKVSAADFEDKSMPKYASAEEFANTVLPILEETLEEIFPSSTAPDNLDRIALETEVGIKALRKLRAHGIDRTAYKSLSAEEMDKSGCRMYKPVADNVGQSGLAARSRALLEGRSIPLSIHDLLSQHVDAVNNDFLLVADSPSAGTSYKVLNFLSGYINAHDGDFDIPQHGPCLARGVISRHYKHIHTRIGNHTAELMVKVDSSNAAMKHHTHLITRRCLSLYIDLKRPSQRWKLNKACKYIMDEIRRTFDIPERVPPLDAHTYKSLLHWFGLLAHHGGDLLLILDGIDVFDDQKEDDPIFWLPTEYPPCIRIIMVGSSVGRLFVGCTALNNARDCKVIRRKSQLSEDSKVNVIQSLAKHHGFATDFETIGPLLSAEKTSATGYLFVLIEELFYKGVFIDAGSYNEERRWGVWETNPLKALGVSPAPPETMASSESCGSKATKEKIFAVIKELLEFDTVKGLMKARLRRLRATAPFFETAICCIRLSRKGLGEEELKSILSGKSAGHREFRRSPGAPATFDLTDGTEHRINPTNRTKESQGTPQQSRRGSRADIPKDGHISPPQSRRGSLGDVAPAVSEQDAAAAVAAAAAAAVVPPPTTIHFHFEDWLRLEPALNQVCMNCCGKFMLSNNELYTVLDELMTEQFNVASVSAAGGPSSPARPGNHSSAPSNANTKSKAIIKDAWKSPFILMIIDVFTASLASHRKAEELPFATRYYCKTFDPAKDKKKLAKWKDILFKQVLDIDLFCRLNTESIIEDLLASLKLCNAEPISIAATLRSNFDTFFGVSTISLEHQKKKMPTLSSAGYELLGQTDIEKSDLDRFRVLGSRFLCEIGHFYHNHLQLHVEAQELLESALMMVYCTDKYSLSAFQTPPPPTTTPGGSAAKTTNKTARSAHMSSTNSGTAGTHEKNWVTHPKSVQCACECLATLGSIYLLRYKAYSVYTSMTIIEKRAAVAKRKADAISVRMAALETRRDELEGNAGHGGFATTALNNTTGKGRAGEIGLVMDDPKNLVIAADPGDLDPAALIEKIELCTAVATRIDSVSSPDDPQLKLLDTFFSFADKFQAAELLEGKHKLKE